MCLEVSHYGKARYENEQGFRVQEVGYGLCKDFGSAVPDSTMLLSEGVQLDLFLHSSNTSLLVLQ